MAAKRTLGWISGMTLVTVMAGCASQTPSMTAPDNRLPNTGPAIIEGDSLFVPNDGLSVQTLAGKDGMSMGTRWTAQDFATLPKRIEVASVEAKNLIPSGGMQAPAPSTGGPGYAGPGNVPLGAGMGAFNLNFPGVWAGSFAGGAGYCPSPYGFAFGTPAVFPKTLFIHPDVYYYRRNALYFPYSRLGGYFYPISVPYGARFYTPCLAYGFGGFSPYTFTSATCPIGQPFPGQLPVGPGLGGADYGAPGVGAGGYIAPGMGHRYGDRHDQRQHRQTVRQDTRMGSRSY
jgi:hypothetical protein